MGDAATANVITLSLRSTTTKQFGVKPENLTLIIAWVKGESK